MPRGPKGEKRPADVIGNAVKVMRIATGEEVEILGADDAKDPAARTLGKKGGAARARNMTPERRAVWYNWIRIHKTLRVTPAMAAGLSTTVMDWSDIAEAMDADTPAKKRGPYKKATAEISN
jgi:hypothetical protein